MLAEVEALDADALGDGDRVTRDALRESIVG